MKLETLKRRWLKATGDDMPDSIARMDIEAVKRALKLAEAGNHVFIPKGRTASITKNESCESMMQWDSHNEH